eukprot:GGOE01061464.1.p1 GENE.GGOE01061464.1~~GGOE01061464.1.p1  ORF type:complete len:233 (+),score=32.23 GGOE01061464.1:56-754(+)
MIRTAFLLGCGGALYAQSSTLQAKSRWGASPVHYERDLEKSDLKIWLSKKGVMSAVGHNLVLKVHDWQSKISITPGGECELYVEADTSSIQVWNHWKPTKEGGVPGINGVPVTLHPMDSWSIGQIHGTMRGKDVLEIAKYPKVVYQGKGQKKGNGLQFEGAMVLKGVDKPLHLSSVITVEGDEKGRPCFVMKGETTFLQSNWGIKPLSVFMGSLQLKDEITAQWEVRFVAKE